MTERYGNVEEHVELEMILGDKDEHSRMHDVRHPL